jgi:succinate dehydrogenase / fumarate reductase flavoprotein subunit
MTDQAGTNPSEVDEGHGFEQHAYDVVVIGAGGAGLRSAIAAHDAGAKAAIVC